MGAGVARGYVEALTLTQTLTLTLTRTLTLTLALAWAQVWRENTSKEHALKMVTLDPHGPNEYRTNGPLANMPEFHAAFGVAEGDALWIPPAERVDIW